MAGNAGDGMDERRLLQELQYQIDGLSLQDSLKSVSAAEAQLRALRLQQAEVEGAQRRQKQAQRAVASAACALRHASEARAQAAQRSDEAWRKCKTALCGVQHSEEHAENGAQVVGADDDDAHAGASTGRVLAGPGVEMGEVKEDAYSWSQADDSVSIHVDIAQQLLPVRAEDVVCTFSATKLVLSVKGFVIIRGELSYDVIPHDCTWGLVDKTAVTIELSKSKHGIAWERVVKQKPKVLSAKGPSHKLGIARDKQQISTTSSSAGQARNQPAPQANSGPRSDETQPPSLVRAFLSPVLEESDVRPGGFVRVKYEFTTQSKRTNGASTFRPTESDAVGILLAEQMPAKAVSPSFFKDTKHETFEFLPDAATHGTIDVPLPAFGGRFALQLIPAQEHEGAYCFAHGSNSNFISVPITLSASHHRGAKAVTTNSGASVRCLLELYKNIQRIHVNLSLVDSSSHFLCRPATWFDSEGSFVASVTETCRKIPDGCSCSDRTHVFKLTLPDSVRDAIQQGDVMGEISQDGCVTVRIPYASADSTQLDAQKVLNEGACRGICCAFCSATVVAADVIGEVKSLPTGYFDNMLEDIVCCENPIQPLASDTVATQAGVCMTGTSMLVLHPTDIAPNTAFSTDSQLGHFGRAIQCPRCEVHLGEATMAPEFEEEEATTVCKLQGFGVLDVSIPFHRIALRSDSRDSIKLANYEQVLASVISSTWNGFGCPLTVVYCRELPDQLLLLRTMSNHYAVQVADTTTPATLQCNFNSAVRVCFQEITRKNAIEHAPSFDSPVTSPAFVAELEANTAEAFQLVSPKSGRGLGLGLRCRWLTVQPDEYLQAKELLCRNRDQLPSNQRHSPFSGFQVGFICL